MKLLALDASTNCTGWAVGELNGRFRPERWGSIIPGYQLYRPERIKKTVAKVLEIVISDRCNRVVLEDINYGSSKKKDGEKGKGNMTTALILAELRGAIQYALYQPEYGSIVIELAHMSTIKAQLGIAKAMNMKGTPKKADVRIVLDRMGIVTKNEDESDACAIWAASSLRRIGWI